MTEDRGPVIIERKAVTLKLGQRCVNHLTIRGATELYKPLAAVLEQAFTVVR